MENPKIRFKGFTKDWEQRKLGDDLVSIHTGTNLLGSITNTGMPLIKMGNIQRGYFDTSKVEFLAENEQPDKADIANYGDFFFNTRNTLELVGKGATWMKNSGEYAFNSNIARFELRNLDTIFFNYLYNTDYMTKQIHARAMGTTSVAAIYPRTLDSVEYLAPCMKEQQKIGAYFKQLDHLITLHQRKCEQTKKLKKYMLQKMFPQNGEKVPEIRFDGFTYDWEQRKFCDVAVRASSVSTSSSDIPSVEYEDVVAEEGRLNKDIRLKEAVKSGIIFDGSQVLYGKLRPYLHNWLNPDFNGIAVGDWWVLKPINMDKNFLYRLIQTQQFDNIANQSSGSKMPRADWNLISNSDFMVPFSKEEQCKIGGYFDSLDNLITIHQRKCDELKKMKKYMLQNMFI